MTVRSGFRIGFQVKVLKTFQVAPEMFRNVACSLESGSSANLIASSISGKKLSGDLQSDFQFTTQMVWDVTVWDVTVTSRKLQVFEFEIGLLCTNFVGPYDVQRGGGREGHELTHGFGLKMSIEDEIIYPCFFRPN